MPLINETMIGGVNAKDCTATSADILEGKTAVVGKEIITGTMNNNGSVNTAIFNGVLKKGYTSGGTIANLEEENIKQGVTIAGKTGTFSGISGATIKKTSKSVEITFNRVYGHSATGSRYYGSKSNFSLVENLLTSYDSSGLDGIAHPISKFFIFKSITVNKGVLGGGITISSPVIFDIKYSGSASDSTIILNGISSLYSGALDITWGNKYILYYGSSDETKPRGEGILYYDEYEISL